MADIAARRNPRTTPRVVTLMLNVTLGTLAALAMIVPAMTQPAPELWPSVSSGTEMRVKAARDATPVNMAAWRASDAREHPGCRRITGDEKPFSFTHYLVVKTDASRVEMGYGRAVRLSRAGIVWTVGVC